MSNQLTCPKSQTIDPYQNMNLVVNSDGTLSRLFEDPLILPSSDATLSVLTKDIPINPSNNTWLRLFLPRNATLNHNQQQKLPLILFFHAGGFIVLSAASTLFHSFLVEMAETVQAIVASVEYRLAPEHRLPAAYDDAMEALHCIRTSKDEWLTKYADYSNCYLMGSSAGGNIAYHVGLRASAEVNDLEPLKIQGLILRQPFFGGTKRTDSELKYENNHVIPLTFTDLMWELALPIGANRDHEYANLTAGVGFDEKLDKIRELGWRVLVSGTGEDPLVDREKELVMLMEEKGVHVVKDFLEEGYHVVEYFEPSKAEHVISSVKAFIFSSGP
ncbi:carboxylesterase 1-like [Lotus japonicus]|uniref:carboxylesterase 1-like n=1 Tax=Lotus japonicus TaxID=34305 RepID=UPI00258A1393|nr:carboxylesterase 1-like [Lotus japonicus]